MRKYVKTDLHSNREFINKRGHMLSFLLFALAATMMIHNYEAPINELTVAYIEEAVAV